MAEKQKKGRPGKLLPETMYIWWDDGDWFASENYENAIDQYNSERVVGVYTLAKRSLVERHVSMSSKRVGKNNRVSGYK